MKEKAGLERSGAGVKDSFEAELHGYTWNLLRLSAAAAMAALAIHLGGIVLKGDASAFDAALMRALRTPGDLMAIGGPRFERIMRDVTALGSFGVAAMLVGAVGGYLSMSGRWICARALLAIPVGGWLLSNAIKVVIARPRPDVVPMLVTVSDASMPSGHTMMATVLYFTLAGLIAMRTDNVRLHRLAFICALVLTIAVGLSRVYLGVHWPTDVLAAVALGAAWTAAGLRLLTK